MTGRAEVHRLKQILDNTFTRVAKLPADAELQSDYARYLCVLVSGFVEKAVVELILEHTRHHGDASLQRFIEFRTRQTTNVNAQRLQDILGSFDDSWRNSIENFLVDERKAALDSIVSLRNRISHGQSVGLTIARVKEYYSHIEAVIERVADLCDP